IKKLYALYIEQTFFFSILNNKIFTMDIQGLLLSDDPQSEEDYDYTDLDDLQNNNNVNIE
ncbi:26291_t:CDS:1, partial [Dentiscutata erythropus]